MVWVKTNKKPPILRNFNRLYKYLIIKPNSLEEATCFPFFTANVFVL